MVDPIGNGPSPAIEAQELPYLHDHNNARDGRPEIVDSSQSNHVRHCTRAQKRPASVTFAQERGSILLELANSLSGGVL